MSSKGASQTHPKTVPAPGVQRAPRANPPIALPDDFARSTLTWLVGDVVARLEGLNLSRLGSKDAKGIAEVLESLRLVKRSIDETGRIDEDYMRTKYAASFKNYEALDAALKKKYKASRLSKQQGKPTAAQMASFVREALPEEWKTNPYLRGVADDVLNPSRIMNTSLENLKAEVGRLVYSLERGYEAIVEDVLHAGNVVHDFVYDTAPEYLKRLFARAKRAFSGIDGSKVAWTLVFVGTLIVCLGIVALCSWGLWTLAFSMLAGPATPLTFLVGYPLVFIASIFPLGGAIASLFPSTALAGRVFED